MLLNTEAIVLKSFDFRETSKIVTFFTKEQGKLKGVLKGIRKDPKKFGSHADRFSVNDIVVYVYRRSDLHLVSHCDLKQFFFSIREDYRRNIAANYMLELIDTIMPIEQKNEEIYQLMLDYLNTLEAFKDIDRLVHLLQIKVLLYSGFRPHVDSCVKCGKMIYAKARFSMDSGGLVCHSCLTPQMPFTNISNGAISSLLHVEKSSWPKALRMGLTKTVKAEIKYILNNFLVYHLEKNLKSTKYLRSL